MEWITNKQGVDNWLLAIGGWKLGKTLFVGDRTLRTQKLVHLLHFDRLIVEAED